MNQYPIKISTSLISRESLNCFSIVDILSHVYDVSRRGWGKVGQYMNKQSHT